jgi:MATE family multidrug resistance protein
LVAAYCLFDAANILIMGALQGVGDTVWTFGAALLLNLTFLSALWWVDHARTGWEGWSPAQILNLEWGMATVFVMAMALVWTGRFVSGRWKSLRVIESEPVLSTTAPSTEAATS